MGLDGGFIVGVDQARNISPSQPNHSLTILRLYYHIKGTMGEVIENPESIDVTKPSDANVISLGALFGPGVRSALVILNQAITIPIFPTLWQRYTLKICADGGANRLYSYFDVDEEREKYLPHFIVGDLDSLKDDVATWYRERGVKIIPQTTQWATDMKKCLDLVEVYFHLADRGETLDVSTLDEYDGLVQLHKTIERQSLIDVLMIGAVDGRFDHTIQSISVLLQLSQLNQSLRLNYMTPTDIIALIPKGLNYLDYSEASFYHGSNCGLLPLGGDIVLTTKGFKWDVKAWPSSLKGDVSSSNRLVGISGAVVETDNDFVLSVEIDYSKTS